MKTFASVFLFFVIALLVVVNFSSLRDSPAFFVPEITVVSPSNQNSAMANKIAKDLKAQFERFHGLPIWQVSMKEIHALLQDDPRLESFQVQRKLPNAIQVSLVPKKPLAALLDAKKGLVFPLSADGSLLAAMGLAEAPNLPLIRGRHLSSDEALRQQLVKVLSVIPSSGLFSREAISEVLIDKSGEVSVIMSSDGTKVLLGDRLAEKQVSRISQVLKYLKSRSIKGRVIDARFSKKVVVRVRKAS
ncbi:MAG: FtsQ-type POTRA domain-containing protein [Bdellovibrionales bacterium]|nr:FtsQ-type POTRA domain-containing protein [Bdellovibrionales bacterium]